MAPLLESESRGLAGIDKGRESISRLSYRWTRHGTENLPPLLAGSGPDASNYQTNPHPDRYSGDGADQDRLEKLWIVRILPHVLDCNPCFCAGSGPSPRRLGFGSEDAQG